MPKSLGRLRKGEVWEQLEFATQGKTFQTKGTAYSKHQTQGRGRSGTLWVVNGGMGEIRLGQPMQRPGCSIWSSRFIPAMLFGGHRPRTSSPPEH